MIDQVSRIDYNRSVILAGFFIDVFGVGD